MASLVQDVLPVSPTHTMHEPSPRRSTAVTSGGTALYTNRPSSEPTHLPPASQTSAARSVNQESDWSHLSSALGIIFGVVAVCGFAWWTVKRSRKTLGDDRNSRIREPLLGVEVRVTNKREPEGI